MTLIAGADTLDHHHRPWDSRFLSPLGKLGGGDQRGQLSLGDHAAVLAIEVLVWLDLPRLREALAEGEVRFGARDLPVPPIDPGVARRAAAEAVADGVVLMFIDSRPVSDLDERWQVAEDSRVRYVRVSAQRGL